MSGGIHRGLLAAGRWLMVLALLGLPPAAGAAHAGTAPLRVGSETGFPPYADVDALGRPVGFSVDLFAAVAKTLGLPVEFRAGAWDAVWRDLQGGKLDALPLVARSPEREALVEFTLPHTVGVDAFFVRAGAASIHSIEQARPLSIIVMRGDAGQEALASRGFDRRLVAVESLPEAFRLLASGSHDAVLAPLLQGNMILQRLQLTEAIEAGPPLKEYQRQYAFAVPKGQTELRDQLERGIAIVKASGEYRRLHSKWLARYEPPVFSLAELLRMGAILAAPVALLALWTWALGLQVRRRTRSLSDEVEARKAAERALLAHRENLEQLVAERTTALEAAREAAEAAAREAGASEARYRLLVEQAVDGIFVTDGHGRFLDVNSAGARMLGYAREELLGMSVADTVLPEEVSRLAGEKARFACGEVIRSEWRVRRKDGSSFHGEMLGRQLPDGRMQGILRDVTERKRVEEARRESELARRIIAVQEGERRNLSQALHDTASPNLAAIRLNLGLVAGVLDAKGDKGALARLQDTQALVADTSANLRELCFDLRPAALDYFGLEPAIRSYAHQFEARTGIAVAIRAPGGLPPLSPDLENTLFRVVQEALTNCAKHSGANTVELVLEAAGGSIRLVVADDGVGFDRERLANPGLGLLTMRERVELAGGRFDVSSQPGEGTRITVEIGEGLGREAAASPVLTAG